MMEVKIYYDMMMYVWWFPEENSIFPIDSRRKMEKCNEHIKFPKKKKILPYLRRT